MSFCCKLTRCGRNLTLFMSISYGTTGFVNIVSLKGAEPIDNVKWELTVSLCKERGVAISRGWGPGLCTKLQVPWLLTILFPWSILPTSIVSKCESIISLWCKYLEQWDLGTHHTLRKMLSVILFKLLFVRPSTPHKWHTGLLILQRRTLSCPQGWVLTTTGHGEQNHPSKYKPHPPPFHHRGKCPTSLPLHWVNAAGK